MSQTLSLESFESAIADDAGPGKEFNQGYEAGFAAGTIAAQTEAAALTETFVQTISDIDFTYTEARGQLLDALSPLFAAITTQILPHCVAMGFADQVAAELLAAAEADIHTPFTLCIHPGQQSAVAAAIADITPQIIVQTDPTLDEHAAWIRHGRNETLLDVDRLLGQITETLNAIDNAKHRTNAHG